jgi:hypothetical protein
MLREEVGMTNAECKKNHKLLWNELSRSGNSTKRIAIKELGLPGANNDCYACEGAGLALEGRENCKKCPISWVDGVKADYSCTYTGSPYNSWTGAKTARTRKKYAKIIASKRWTIKKMSNLGDYDRWFKPCVQCGYDAGKVDPGTEMRCWKCGGMVELDYTDRALKKEAR